jgi:hypothetical protein
MCAVPAVDAGRAAESSDASPLRPWPIRSFPMNAQLLKDALGWGFILWLVGYALGIVLSLVVPVAVVGWLIMPIGVLLTLLVLLKRVMAESLQYYVVLAVTWTLIAVVFDYFLLVKAFNPLDGYYKLDVYLYYACTFFLPLGVGRSKGLSGRPAGHATS